MAGCEPQGQRALMAGAGGAGSAIALALLDSGVAELALHDDDTTRRDALRHRLQERFGARVRTGSSDPSGYTLVVNATPAGMRAGDPLPIAADRLTRDMFVGDVITAPAVTPLLEAARRAGAERRAGRDVYRVSRLIVDFLIESGALAGGPAVRAG